MRRSRLPEGKQQIWPLWTNTDEDCLRLRGYLSASVDSRRGWSVLLRGRPSIGGSKTPECFLDMGHVSHLCCQPRLDSSKLHLIYLWDGGTHRMVAALGPAPDTHKSARDLDETQ